jgi:hypothetical protein
MRRVPIAEASLRRYDAGRPVGACTRTSGRLQGFRLIPDNPVRV